MDAIAKIHAGRGRIAVGCHGSHAVFSELSSTYPLKLISPPATQDRVAVVYALTYGGGLVGGDQVRLSVHVTSSAVLLLLSQGSTKVFKSRADQRLASVRANESIPHVNSQISAITMQKMDFVVATDSALFVLPDPVTCFRSASYNQVQTFNLSAQASLVVLDWITSGRKSLGEDWVFARYYSVNEVIVEGRRIAKDVMLLDETESTGSPLPRRSLADKLAPYSCYATLILYGPLVETVVSALTEKYQKISVMKSTQPLELLWSLSSIASQPRIGVVVRIAGKDTEGKKRKAVRSRLLTSW